MSQQLKVGQVWKDREGREVRIAGMDDDSDYPFYGSNGHSYTLSGAIFKFDDSDKYAVAMLDLDHFKKINDTYGHVIGDDLLKHTVEIMQQSIRSSDIIVRVGGEEFLIIFKSFTLKGAQAACEKLRENIMNTPLKTVGVQTISIGLTNVKVNEDMETVSQRADSALYEAKRNGRNQVVTKR